MKTLLMKASKLSDGVGEAKYPRMREGIKAGSDTCLASQLSNGEMIWLHHLARKFMSS